ncbi:MAG: hypothetical protein ACTHKL_29555, partial [Streptosporangiaceae bacterium]
MSVLPEASGAWTTSPAHALLRVAERASKRSKSTSRRRMTLICGLAMLGVAIVVILLAPVLASKSPT